MSYDTQMREAERRRAAIRLMAESRGVRQAAQHYKISTQRVYQIINGKPKRGG